MTCPVKAACEGLRHGGACLKRKKINHRRLGEVAVLTLSQSEQHEALLRRKIGQIRCQPKMKGLKKHCLWPVNPAGGLGRLSSVQP